jgi:hypothetical protein
LPDEMLLLKWQQTDDLVMDFYFAASPQDLGFGLVDNKGEVIVEANEIVPAIAEAGEIHKQIKFKKLERGFHGIKVSGRKYPMTYKVKIAPVSVQVQQASSQTMPAQFALYQNYPNPFNPGTVIGFDLPQSSHARLEIYNILGERISLLLDGDYQQGVYRIRWNGCDADGNPLPDGVYFYRLSLPDRQDIKKMTLLR